jgi:hypothetical protein
MPARTSSAQGLAICRAARSFTRALVAEAMAPRTARLEAVLYAGAADSLFSVDYALIGAWPQDGEAPPRHEVIWARDAGDLEGLRLSAFDASGRLLLRRTYAADSEGHARNVRAPSPSLSAAPVSSTPGPGIP